MPEASSGSQPGPSGDRAASDASHEATGAPIEAADSGRPLRLFCFPHLDTAFERWAAHSLEELRREHGTAVQPATLEQALRAAFPLAVVRAREELASLGTDEAWYVYRDGRYSPFSDETWWRSPDVMWLDTGPDGCYVDASESFLELSGYQREQITGMRTGDLADPEVRRMVPWTWELLAATGVLHSTSIMRAADGRRIAVEYRLARDGAGPGFARSYLRVVPLAAARSFEAPRSDGSPLPRERVKPTVR